MMSMKESIAWVNQLLVNKVRFITLFSLLISLEVMAFSTEVCGFSSSITTLEAGSPGSLQAPLYVPNTFYEKYKWHAVQLDNTVYQLSTSNIFTPAASHLGTHEIIVRGTKKASGGSFISPITEAYVHCSKTLIVRNVTTPTVIFSPVPPTKANLNTIITLKVNGHDDGKDLTKIEMYVGKYDHNNFIQWTEIKFCTGPLDPFTFKSRSVENLSCAVDWSANTVGTFNFKALATDENGNQSALAEVNFMVNEINTKPLVTLNTPTQNIKLNQGSSFTLTATATDIDAEVINQLKTFKLCSGPSGRNVCDVIKECTVTSGQACTVNDITFSTSTYVWAEASDGHVTEKSDARSVTIDRKPSVAFTLEQRYVLSPSINESGNNVVETIGFTVTPTDDVRVDKVQICYGAVNSSCANELKRCDVTSGRTCSDDFSANFAAGTYNIFAVATDSSNQKSLSQPISLVVYSGQGVRIISPSAGSQFDERSIVNVTAKTEALVNSLQGKLAKVDFYLDGALQKTIAKNCADTTNNITDEVSANINVGIGPEYSLTAVATDCVGRVSRHSAAVNIQINERAPQDAPIVQTISGAVPSLSGEFTVKANLVSGAQGYHWYENNDSSPIASTVQPTLLIRKSYSENGTYSYCAQAYNHIGTSSVGTGNKCKSIVVARVEAMPTAPVFNNISLQQSRRYSVAWPTDLAQAEYFELWGSVGNLASPNWSLLSGGPNTNVSSYLQYMPNVGNYSYQLKACNSQSICIAGQQMTINHQAPYLQNAEFEPYFDSVCGADCLVLTGLALTDESIVSIQVRNSTESYIFSEHDLIEVNENTLKIKANLRIRDGLSNGGIAIELSNSIVNANTATIVLDNTGVDERFDLINHAPTVSDNNTIYVGIDRNIHSLNSINGDSNIGWPYETNGDVVAAPILSKDNNQNDLIYVGSKDHNFYALRQNGDLYWKTKTRGEIIASAALDEANQLYVGSMDKSLYALSADNGDIQWQYPFPVGISQKPTLSGDGLVYITTDDEQIHIIDRRNIGIQGLRWQDIDSSLIQESLAQINNWQPKQGEIPELKIIARMFYGVLQRSPTERELSFFAYSASLGLSLDEIANAFLNSEQGLLNFPKNDNNSVFLDKLYSSLFPNGEPNSVAGHNKAYWLAQLEQGLATRAAIVVALVSSVEYGAYADNLVLAVLYYFYEECQLAHGCVFQGDSDGDGYSDAFENEHGFNPLDPRDTFVAIPELTATAANLGEFILDISSIEQPTHYKIMESINGAEFVIIADALTANSLTLTKAVANYRYQAQACIRSICSEPSNFVEVIIADSVIENGITPESAPQTVAPKNAPSLAAINSSARLLMTSGAFRVTENGTASFNVPIALPQGIAGVTPSVALSYDSQRGESSAGVGWGISAGSSISRCRQTQVTDGQFAALSLDENDRYCLDGQRLILVSHDSTAIEGTIGAHYRTEIDNGLEITVEQGTHDSEKVQFKVKGRDGSISLYGGTANAESVVYGVTITWLLQSTTDNLNNVDNTIAYHYTHGGFKPGEIGLNEVVLSSISYSGNRVEFTYLAGNVRTSGNFQGTLNTTSSELTNIEVFNHLNEEVRSYKLNYQLNNITKRELQSISECVNTICKQPVVFTYRPTLDSADISFEQLADVFTSTNKIASSVIQDVDGNGKNDLITLVQVSGESYRLCVDFADNTQQCVSLTRGNEESTVPLVLTDEDGNGVLEILVMMDDLHDEAWAPDKENWQKFTLEDGILTLQTSITNRVGGSHFNRNGSLRSFDFDGDGYNDLLSIRDDTLRINFWQPNEQQYSIMTFFNDFSGNNSTRFVDQDMFKGGWQTADFNGDGRGDIIAWACESDCIDEDTRGDRIQIFNSTSDGLSAKYLLSVEGKLLSTGDFNTDGFTDIMVYNSSSKRWQYYLNRDGAFVLTTLPLLPDDKKLSSDIAPVMTDIDKDGLIDLFAYADGDWYRFEWSPADNRFILYEGIFLAGGSLNVEKGDSAYFTDWNNDGLLDFVVKTQYKIKAYMNVYAPAMPGLLHSVQQANQLDHVIEYGTMADPSLYENYSAPLLGTIYYSAPNIRAIYVGRGPSPLVSSVTSSTPSTADNNAESIVSYHYEGAKAKLGGRGWQGFAKVTTTTEKGNATFSNTTRFHQNFPLTGMPFEGIENLHGEAAPISKNSSFYRKVVSDRLNGTKTYQVTTRETRSCQATVSRDSSEVYSVGNYQCSQTLLEQNADGDTTSTINSAYTDSSAIFFTAGSHVSNENAAPLADWLSQTETTNTYIKAGRLSNTTVVHRRADKTDVTREAAFTYYPLEHAHENMLWTEEVEPNGDCSAYLKTTHTYDTWGNKVQSSVNNKSGCTDAINRIVINTYDSEGRYIQSTSNSQFTTKTINSRNGLGLPLKVTDVNGVESDFAYDAFGNLVHSYSASGAQATKLNQGCVLGNCYMQVASSKNSQQLKIDYIDMAGRVFQSDSLDVFGGNHTASVEYDKYGRTTSTIAPGMLAVTSTYDIFDRKITDIDPNSNLTTTATINGLSHVTTISGDMAAGDQVRTTVLNALGENSTVTDNLGNVLTYTYDTMGNLATVHSSADAMITVENDYDALGRKTDMRDKDAGTWHYEYNALGNITKQTDARGVITQTYYDSLGRKTSQSFTGNGANDNTSYWDYSAHRLTAERSGTWQRNHYYDALGRLNATLTSLDQGASCSNGVSYSTTSNELRITDQALTDPVASHCVIQQTNFDQYGRVFQKFDDYRKLNTGQLIEARGIRYHYAYGQVLKQQEAREGINGRIYSETLTLNAFGGTSSYRKGTRTITLGTDDAGRTTSISSGASDYIQQDSYSYDSLGNVKERSLTNQAAQTFTYDKLNRLTHVNGTQLYNYQNNGNFISKDGWSHSYNETINSQIQPLHALTSRSKNGVIESFEYDANGNQTIGLKAGQAWRSIAYNARNKATAIETDGKVTQFSYDANNTRFKRVDNKQTVYYVGGLELTLAIGENGLEDQQFIKRYVAGQAMQTYYSAGNAHLKWLYKDNLGSLVAITNDGGKLLTRFSYDAFGFQKVIEPTQFERDNYYAFNLSNLLAKIPDNIRGYTNHEPVGDDGRIIHMNGRIYDPTLGRFLQADPIIQSPSDSQSYNRYSYVMNNPLTLTDPSGFSWLSKTWKKIKPFIGVIVAVVGSIVCPACSPYLIGAIAGAASAAANGGNIIQGALIGAFTAGAGQYGFEAAALAGGIASKAQGGNFGHGFWAGGAGSAIGGGYGKAWAKVVTAAIVGGTISKLTGGKFKNGAISAAFSAAMANAASGYKNRPLEEGSAEWEAREEEYFQAEQKEMMNALATGQDLIAAHWPSLPQGVVDFSAGLGDALLLGYGDELRSMLDISSVNMNSDAYSYGEYSSYAVGGARLTYSGLIKGYSYLAPSGLAASTFRSNMKSLFRFGAGKNWRPVNLSKYPTDALLRSAAGRSNIGVNAYAVGVVTQPGDW
jgi:RHS repeat-associated protein